MHDPIQADLLAWLHEGRRARGERALAAIACEWRPRVARTLSSDDDVDDALQEALLARCLPKDGVIACVAPDGADAKAWRRRILKNFLLDRLRSRGRRSHAVLSFSQGLAPSTDATLWRARKSANSPPDLPSPKPVVQDRAVAYLSVQRREVLDVLPQLAVRRRVLLCFALRGDPSCWSLELASDLKHASEAVDERMRIANRVPGEPVSDHLTREHVAVIWPPVTPKDIETARKTLERAAQDAQRILGES